MKASPLARLILYGFICIFISAVAYLLLDALGIWSKLPGSVTYGVEVVTGLVLLFALLAHLVLATGSLPSNSAGDRPGR